MRHELEKFRGALHGPAGSMVIVPEGCSQATEDGRKEAARLLYELYPATLGYCAVVIEGHGIWARAQRGIFSIIGAVSRTPIPWDVFESSEASVRWLLPHLHDPRESAMALSRTVVRLRSEL